MSSGGLEGDEAIVWEHSVAENAPYLLPMKQHTVSLCPNPPLAEAIMGFSSSPAKAANEWGLLIVPAGEVCKLLAHGAVTLWNLSLAPAMLARARRGASASTPHKPRASLPPRLRAGAGVDDIVLRSLMFALHHGLRGLRPATRQFAESTTQAIATHLVEQHCIPSSVAPAQLADEEFARLNAFLDSQFSERCSVEDVADMLGMNAMRFARLLKARTGQSFSRYCMQRRLERSFQLLHSGQMNVTEAAMETCFASLAHFSRVFHKHFGVPPSALKR